jgi:hypothetical protein
VDVTGSRRQLRSSGSCSRNERRGSSWCSQWEAIRHQSADSRTECRSRCPRFVFWCSNSQTIRRRLLCTRRGSERSTRRKDMPYKRLFRDLCSLRCTTEIGK